MQFGVESVLPAGHGLGQGQLGGPDGARDLARQFLRQRREPPAD